MNKLVNELSLKDISHFDEHIIKSFNGFTLEEYNKHISELHKTKDQIEQLRREINDLNKQLTIKESNIFELEGIIDKNRFINKNNLLVNSKTFETFDTFL